MNLDSEKIDLDSRKIDFDSRKTELDFILHIYIMKT